MLATPVATVMAPPSPTTKPEQFVGKPASTEDVYEITAFTRELVACSNAGDFFRLTALFTDEAARNSVLNGWGQSIQQTRNDRSEQGRPDYTSDELVAMIVEERPLPTPVRGSLVSVSDVQVVPDGRYTALVVRTLGDGHSLQSLITYQYSHDRFLLAEEQPLALDGTPTP